MPSAGPLAGVKIVELAGAGPGPFCCMLLADMGAEIIQVDRVEPVELGTPVKPEFQFLNRGRRSITLDLKRPEAIEIVKKLVAGADMLTEGFRPGVTERLGLGPEACFAVNPRLVYGRTTGWGQDGPLSQVAGHDINYIALTGALDAMGVQDGPPVPPLNLLGDFAGGGLYLAFGLLCGLLEARQSGKGQIVDAAIVDGTVHLMTAVFAKLAAGTWSLERGANTVAGGAPWYSVYRTKDDKYISTGPIEGRFFRALMARLGLDTSQKQQYFDQSNWSALTAQIAQVFLSKTRDEWTAELGDADVCFAPVLDVQEAQVHPHMVARKSFVEIGGHAHPAPAPRFSRSHTATPSPPPMPGEHTVDVLRELGFSDAQIRRFREADIAR